MDYSKMTIREFYPVYLAAHKHPATKLWHFFGQFLTLSYILGVLWLAVNVHWLGLALLWHTTEVIYIPAWLSHKHIEKNVPLGKTAKWKSKWCDLKMFWDVLIARKVPLDGR